MTTPRSRSVLAFLALAATFAVLLGPLPWRGEILGSLDTLLGLALSRTYLNEAAALLGGPAPGRALYPEHLYRYGETALGGASVFAVFSLLGCADVWALWLYQLTLLTLNAFAMFLFARTLVTRDLTAFVAALAFGASGFLWANVDDLQIHAYALPLVAALLLRRGLKGADGRSVILAGLVGGLQFYVSVQVYVYQTILVGLLALPLRGGLRRLPRRSVAAGLLLYLLVPLPLLVFHLGVVSEGRVMDLWNEPGHLRFMRLQVEDLLQNLPGRLLSPSFTHQPSVDRWTQWTLNRHSAFIGLLVPLLALGTLIRRPDLDDAALACLALTGFVFALGPVIEAGSWSIPSPLKLCYDHVPLFGYLRVAFRSYSLTVLALALLAARTLDRIADAVGTRGPRLVRPLLVAASIIVLCENTGVPVNRTEVIPYPAIPPAYAAALADVPDAVVLDLPSKCTIFPYYIDEVIYDLWQTHHRRSIVGGVNGYYPRSRVELQAACDSLPAPSGWQFLRRLGVTHLAFHRSAHLYRGIDDLTPEGRRLILSGPRPDDEQRYEWLEGCPELEKVAEAPDVSIYRLLPARK